MCTMVSLKMGHICLIWRQGIVAYLLVTDCDYGIIRDQIGESTKTHY